jgi:mono/diheme cytochrome c family protein
MKNTTTSLTVLLTSAVLAAGCSGGGGGGGSASTFAPITSGGSLSSQLPTERRDTAGYTYGTSQNNTIRGGQVTALGVAPTGTATFVGHSPLAQVDLLDNGALTVSGNLFYDASSFAMVGTSCFAATSNPSRGGAGDVHAFVNGAWQRVIDSNDAEAIVAAVNSEVFAAHGGVGSGGTVKQLNQATGAWVTIAGLNSSIPTSAAGLKGDLFVGCTGNAAQGGAARLFRISAGKATEIMVPGAQGGFNVRQEISAMLNVAPSTSGSIATTGSAAIAPASSGVIVLGIANLDVATGAPLGGKILVTDGVSFEELHSFTDDAPTSLALHDNTIFVGTAKGKLMRRAPTGTFVDEPNFPAVTSVQCLLSRDSATLYVGVKGATGAQTIRRSGLSGAVNTGGGTQTDRYYRPDVKAVLLAKCASCHASPGLPTALTVFALSANLANDATDNTTVKTKVNLTTPGSSLLLTKALGQLNHLGGAVLTTSSPEYGVLLAWIQQGARYEAVTTPPPASKTYVADVKPILNAKNCLACHTSAATNTTFHLSAGLATDATDYAAIMSRINSAVPEQSLFLRKVAQSSNTTHTGGTLIAQNSPEYATLLLWIQQGAKMQ